MPGFNAHRAQLYWLAISLFLAMVLLLMPETAAGQVQYRQSDLEFLQRLAERVDGAEQKLVALSTRNSKYDSESNHVVMATPEQSVAAKQSEKPAEAYARVSERMRHKQRAINDEPDDLGRIKVRFPTLSEQIENIRRRIDEQQRMAKARDTRPHPKRKDILETQRQVEELEAGVRKQADARRGDQ